MFCHLPNVVLLINRLIVYMYSCSSSIAQKQLSSYPIDFLNIFAITQRESSWLNIMIMVNQDFLANQNIDETNSLLVLVQNILLDCNEEVNYIDHSIYDSDQDYKEYIARSKDAL